MKQILLGIIAGTAEFIFESDAYLAKLNASGQEIWKTTLTDGLLAKVIDLEISPTGDIFILTGHRDACNHQSLTFYKLNQYDKDGVLIIEKDLTSNDEFLDMLILNKSIILVGKSYMQGLDSLTANVWSHSFGNLSTNVILKPTHAQQALIFRDNEIIKLNPLTGVLNQPITTNYAYGSVSQKNGMFYFVDTNGIVSSVDSILNPSTSSFNISSSLDEVHSFKILPDGRSIMLGKKNQITTLHIF